MNRPFEPFEIVFEELEFNTLSWLENVLYNSINSEGLVYMRYKYNESDDWIYSIECVCYSYDLGGLLWFNDWDEGFEIVEYLKIALY